MTKHPGVLAAAFAALASFGAAAQDAPTLDDLAFLEGGWRGGSEDFTFEETWLPADAGVMTAMARGVSGGELAVLEYILVTQDEDAVTMRFKHYNADFSTWEKDGPTTLTLTSVAENDVTFSADPPSETVKSIRYWMPEADVMQADIVLVEDGEEGGFSLTFTRAGK